MKKHLRPIVLLALFLAITGGTIVLPAFADDRSEITILGLTKDGKQVDVPIKTRFYRKRLAKIFKVINDETSPVLESRLQNTTPWKLDAIDIGLSVKLALGIGILEASVEPGFFLRFKK